MIIPHGAELDAVQALERLRDDLNRRLEIVNTAIAAFGSDIPAAGPPQPRPKQTGTASPARSKPEISDCERDGLPARNGPARSRDRGLLTGLPDAKPIDARAETTGQKIRRMRQVRQWSKDDLADKLDVTMQAVSYWEADRYPVSADKRLLLCKVLSCKLGDLGLEE